MGYRLERLVLRDTGSHNPKVVGSNPAPATSIHKAFRLIDLKAFFDFWLVVGVS